MGAQVRSVDMMTDKLLGNQADIEKLRANPEEAVRQAADFTTKMVKGRDDPLVYRMVVAFLGLTVVVVVFGGVAFAIKNNGADLPSALVALGSAAIGALAGLLAPAPTH
jgi:hypothetical protein